VYDGMSYPFLVFPHYFAYFTSNASKSKQF
jgi:hypothetical protein